MTRATPWILCAILFIAFGISFHELQRVRSRFGEVTRHTFHDHAEVRRFIIRSAIEEAKEPIVILGDSITEMARFPLELCGHPLINAGIGGMTIKEANTLAPFIFEHHPPYIIVNAMGANDIGSQQVGIDYAELMRTLEQMSPRVIGASVITDAPTNYLISSVARGTTYIETAIPIGSKMPDGIHFKSIAYRAWWPPIEKAIIKLCAKAYSQ